MTSNTGFNRSGSSIGFQDASAQQDPEQPLKGIFSPEFLDRLDEVIAFETFDKEQVVVITNQMLDDIRRELQARDIQVTFGVEVAAFLVDRLPRGDSVRPLRGVIRDYIEDPLSFELLEHGNSEPLLVTIENGKAVFARPVPLV
jgi:ATP-dependent Clp protease ATP-binding subunit ClpC